MAADTVGYKDDLGGSGFDEVNTRNVLIFL